MPEDFNAIDDFETSEENTSTEDSQIASTEDTTFSAEEEILDDI